MLEHQGEMSSEEIMLKDGSGAGYFDYYFNFDNISESTGGFKSIDNKIFSLYESA